MKKIFLCLLLGTSLSIYVSCSTENNDTTSSETSTLTEANFTTKSLNVSDLDKAQQLFLDMIATQDYIDLKAQMKAFNRKLGGNNHVSFSTKQDWMTWINANISNTDFTSISEFELFYDDIYGKSEYLVLNNAELYQLIANADNNDIRIIFRPTEGDGSLPDHDDVIPTSCYDNCCASYEAAYDQATEDYFDEIGDGADGTLFGSIITFFTIMDYEHMIYETLPLQFNACVSGC
ncbi:hypothetical protein GWA97_07605 [Flavobacterium sp. LaA7.5]|nr:hypothetical protein [Flavobacterium salilacus subsp. altitudinum]